MSDTPHGVDYTVFFARLKEVGEVGDLERKLFDAFYLFDVDDGKSLEEKWLSRWRDWLARYCERIAEEPLESRLRVMSQNNPNIIPRNWMMYECYMAAGVRGDDRRDTRPGQDFEFSSLDAMMTSLEHFNEVEICSDLRFLERTPKEYQGKVRRECGVMDRAAFRRKLFCHCHRLFLLSLLLGSLRSSQPGLAFLS